MSTTVEMYKHLYSNKFIYKKKMTDSLAFNFNVSYCTLYYMHLKAMIFILLYFHFTASYRFNRLRLMAAKYW